MTLFFILNLLYRDCNGVEIVLSKRLVDLLSSKDGFWKKTMVFIIKKKILYFVNLRPMTAPVGDVKERDQRNID